MLQTDLHSYSYKKGTLVPSCKKCGAQNYRRKGKSAKGITRYQCRDCNFRFIWTSDLPRRHTFSQIMNFAVELYTSPRVAASLRGVAQTIAKAFGVIVSHEAIRQWVIAAKSVIPRRQNKISTVWHVDETYIKIKGVGHWLWIVYCKNYRQILSWHISITRLLDDAKCVLTDALQVAGARPEKIITDGLYQYQAAIKKIIGWNWREQKVRHVIDSGIGKNSPSERVNKEVKRRTRYFGTFQSLEGAKAFAGLWCYHFNQSHAT